MLKAIAKPLAMTLSALALLATAAPARAESAYCVYSYIKWLSEFCDTDSVPANGSSHTVHMEVSSFAHFQVIDDTLPGNVVVFSGVAGAGGAQRTIGGLYARYRVHVSGVPAVAWAYINNN